MTASSRRTAANVGAQADIRISALSAMDLTLSFGGAVAFEDGYKARREFMVSLEGAAVMIRGATFTATIREGTTAEGTEGRRREELSRLAC